MDIVIPKSMVSRELFLKQGINSETVLKNAQLYGRNDYVGTKRSSLTTLLETCKDPMIWFLLVVSGLLYSIGNYTESAVLFLAIIPIASMDAFLHQRTKHSLDKLKKQLPKLCNAIRDGQERSISSDQIVTGDLLRVPAGTYIPADGLIVECSDCLIDQSTLTGESVPNRKTKARFEDIYIKNEETRLNDRFCAFAGCRILKGNLFMRVIHTGKKSIYGHIMTAARSIDTTKTPLQKWTGKFITKILIAALILCALLAIIRVYQGFGWLDALINASMLAIAALPEEFPIVFTMFLAMGIYDLSQKKALVRTGVTIENMAHIDFLCSDKTGTMTTGQLSLGKLFPYGIYQQQDLKRYLILSQTDDINDPVEKAIHNIERNKFDIERLSILPFKEETKISGLRYKLKESSILEVYKGAPETILKKTQLGSEEKSLLLRTINDLARDGSKVLAVGKVEREYGEAVHWSNEIDFCGFVTFSDQIKPRVKESVNECQKLGVKVIMITGDHPEAAGFIARKAGLDVSRPDHILNAELVNKNSWISYLKNKAPVVIARAQPMQKLEIIESLQKLGNIVAVTGDGINDIPALKRANISIAMGQRGTEAARDIASIVLLDDNFSTIVGAIKTGAQVLRHIKLGFTYLMIIHIPFILSTCFIPMLSFPKLFEPIHIVLIETMIHPTAILGFLESKTKLSPTLLNKNLRQNSLFTKTDVIRIIFFGFIATLICIIGYWVGIKNNPMLPNQATSFVILTLVTINTSIVAALSSWRNRMGIIVNIFILTFFGLLMSISTLRDIAFLSMLPPNYWMFLLMMGGCFYLFLRLSYNEKARPKTRLLHEKKEAIAPS